MKLIFEKIMKHWPLVIIVVLAIGLRLPFLNGSLWLDEAAQALESARPFAMQYQIRDDFQPPFLHYLLHFVLYIASAASWLRVWGALLPGLISIIATYFLARKIFGGRAAIAVSLLLATNSQHIFLSQELRPYMWSVAWTMLSTWCLWRLTAQSEKENRSDKSPFIGWLIFSVLGLYTSYIYPFVFLSQLIVLGWRKKWRTIGWGIGVTGFAFLPWLPFFLDQLKTGTMLGTLMPGWTQVVSFDQLKSVWMTGAKFIYGVSNLELNWFYVSTALVLLIAVVVLAIFFWRKKSHFTASQKIYFTFLILLLVLPFLLAWLASFLVPLIQPKRVIFLLPFFYLLIVGAIAAVASDAKSFFLAKLILPLLLMINLISTFNYYTDVQLQREDWRGLLAEIHQTQDETKAVALFSYQSPFSPWTWYEQQLPAAQQFATVSTGTYYLPDDPQWQTKIAEVKSYETVLVFDYLRDLTDPQHQLDTYLKDLGYQEIGVYDYPNLGFVRIFRR